MIDWREEPVERVWIHWWGIVGDPEKLAELRAYLEKLLAGPVFSGSPRRMRLMRYLVDRTLAGEGDRVNEYSIGIDIFEKPPSFDPRLDSVVRTDIARLRQRLRAYYAGDGSGDPVVLDLPPKTYRVAIEFRPPETNHAAEAAEATQAAETAEAFEPVARAERPRWMPWILAFAVLAAAGIFFWRLPRRPSVPQSLVVLPFLDLSSGHQFGYLADGVTEEITNDLANLDNLRVIARTTAFQFKGKSVDVRELGKQLHVDAVLEGSLDREGDRVRIRAQLNRASDGYHLWSHAYDLQAVDMIQVQEEIARSIADDLQLNRAQHGASSAASRGVTTDAEAHDLFLRGQGEWNIGSLQSFRNAVTFFQKAIDRDPHFARAWLGMAKAHWNIGLWTAFSEATAAQVESEAERALELAPGLTEAHAVLAYVAWNYDYDWPRAEREFKLALSSGGQANVHNLYGLCLAQRRRFSESYQQFHIAEELSPLDAVPFFNEAQTYEWEGRTGDAERAYLRVLHDHPAFEPPVASLAYMKAILGRCQEAAKYADKMKQLAPNSYRTRSVRWTVAVCEGQKDAARQALQTGLNSTPPFELANAFAMLHDPNQAIAYLEKGVDQHSIGATSMQVEPYLASLRTDPRFVALERRLGLEP